MSSVANQVVLHPLASQSLKLLSTTLGRDKLYRAVQYFSRFFAWLLLSRGDKLNAARWNALKAHLTLGRKLMRLGKPLEHLQAALRALHSPIHSSTELGEQLTTIARQLSYFGYLMYDSFVWANAVKFFNLKPSTGENVSRLSNRFWFAGILFSITNGLLKAGRLASEVQRLQGMTVGEKGVEVDRDLKLAALRTAREATRHQFIIDILDVWIPATNLGFVNFNDGVLGIFGLVTSLMALNQQWAAAGRK
ncbi:peroxisomal biogenesis factor [Sparassis latifolia]|uniref:Peroxisomal biogenesis factor 11 n=1 Tax=Sparassis crispa TaxID=139825 RepID=A0A401G6X4_9APHY|nr:peroxisomal biogenesis factor 11 [Sparassis crispa]GBE77920.1 peroxisomal biogenesis factor 11 [Sparassis crispa]